MNFPNITLIKLGGCILTDPGAKDLFDRKNARRIARELAPYSKGCILVHGTGHVGKPPAIKYNYYKTGILPPGNNEAGLEIRNSIKKLHLLVLKELHKEGIPVVSVNMLDFVSGCMYNFTKTEPVFNTYANLTEMPLKWESRIDSGHSPINVAAELLNYPGNSLISITERKLTDLIHAGFVPVISADFVPFPDGSFRVLSSDYITLQLAQALNPSKVLFLTDVDGVYRDFNTGRQSLMNEFTQHDLPLLTATETNDVSGSMRKKVETALKASRHTPSCIIASGIKAGVVTNLMQGGISGTLVKQLR